MDAIVDEIKKKTDIVELINGYTQVKKAGRNFKALCPFHKEKTPSFVISPDRQIWHCFGTCGDGGDVIKFLMKLEGITFSEAVTELAERAKIPLQNFRPTDTEWNEKKRMYQLNLLAAEYYEFLLHNSKFGQKARDYLKARGINEGIVKKFQLGYSPISWDSLLTFLKKKKFSEEEMNTLGLVIKKDNGGCYDRFRGRLMFPIKDVRGNVIGFAGRLLESSNDSAKYVNTPETPLYRKRETLFGIDIAKEAIRTEGNVFIVEGEFDVITPYQYGIENIVAIKGTAVTRDQLMLLKRYTQRITLALDADSAGEEAIRRGIEAAEEEEIETNIILMPDGKDPDEAARKDVASFKKALTKPIPIYDFVIDLAQKKHPESDVYEKKKIGFEVIPYLSKIKNPIVQSYYVKKLANILDVSEESILNSMKRQQTSFQRNRKFIAKPSHDIKDRATELEKYLMSLLFQNEQPYLFANQIFTLLKIDDFTLPVVRKICLNFLEYKESHSEKFDLQAFTTQLPNELRSPFDELYLYSASDLEFLDTQLEKLMYDLKRLSVKKRIADLLKSDMDDSTKEPTLIALTKELKEVEKRLATV